MATFTYTDTRPCARLAIHTLETDRSGQVSEKAEDALLRREFRAAIRGVDIFECPGLARAGFEGDALYQYGFVVDTDRDPEAPARFAALGLEGSGLAMVFCPDREVWGVLPDQRVKRTDYSRYTWMSEDEKIAHYHRTNRYSSMFTHSPALTVAIHEVEDADDVLTVLGYLADWGDRMLREIDAGNVSNWDVEHRELSEIACLFSVDYHGDRFGREFFTEGTRFRTAIFTMIKGARKGLVRDMASIFEVNRPALFEDTLAVPGDTMRQYRRDDKEGKAARRDPVPILRRAEGFNPKRGAASRPAMRLVDISDAFGVSMTDPVPLPPEDALMSYPTLDGSPTDCGPLLLLGMNRRRGTPVALKTEFGPFGKGMALGETGSTYYPRKPVPLDPWSFPGDRVVIHKAVDGFRFLFGVTAYTRARQGKTRVPVMITFAHFVPMTACRTVRPAPIYRGASVAVQKAMSSVPGLVNAMENARQEYLLQVRKLGEHVKPEWCNLRSDATTLPKGHVVTYLGWDPVETAYHNVEASVFMPMYAQPFAKNEWRTIRQAHKADPQARETMRKQFLGGRGFAETTRTLLDPFGDNLIRVGEWHRTDTEFATGCIAPARSLDFADDAPAPEHADRPLSVQRALTWD